MIDAKKPLLTMQNVSVTANNHKILNNLNLTIHEKDFITVLGANGAGKSTLFNTISGNLLPSSGHIFLQEQEITNWSVIQRTKFLSRVFQDPKVGTAPRLTVAENLLLSLHRGQKRRLRNRHLKQHLGQFQQITQAMYNDLDQHLNTATENLSGGQRQALSFLMAVQVRPKLLLLDEHTAALDPKTSHTLMTQTNKYINKDRLTCLMITHQLDDALQFGNRLLVLDQGKIKYDFDATQKSQLTKEQLLQIFERAN
ncbi:ABC transporter ATP-binding protein [Bombilactobacillus thymidiniphilus]|uniref:ATP-binding cassette domain-containing protein n=1 Tax=Bombilactobacillus thymidiniphilus TaxID=2923363 RepID=A0ABY4PBU8_9LACO|nr:ATP-binding cassette domain-containing protein [Bombilactobacillus thymidiniphilus]UQS83240.1 ATP-binding cassette domain-containing protein [Bombilactobacillus thymidiniphilus]